YSKLDLTRMMISLNSKSLNDDFTDSIVIIKSSKDTFKLKTYYFGDLGPFSDNKEYYEMIRAHFIINAVNTNRSELIFTNIQIKHRNHSTHAKRAILKIVVKGIKKELKKTNQQSDK
ncbi:MAG: hypothetical protein P1P88_02650, partial [Bacteroidales bacterium]|nr:hypothetical protein [Bacteroidales bacterium]